MPVYTCAAYSSAITKAGLHSSHISHFELIHPTLLDVSCLSYSIALIYPM